MPPKSYYLAEQLQATQRALKPGEAEVIVGPDGYTWNPRTGRPLLVRAYARPRSRKNGNLYVRFHAGRRPCAASYATDAGEPLSMRASRLPGGGPPGSEPVPGITDVISRARHTWRAQGPVRFCVWVAASPQTHTRPVAQDVTFYDHIFGAAVTYGGSTVTDPITPAWGGGGTDPFRVVEKATSSEAGCASEDSLDGRDNGWGFYSTYGGGGRGTFCTDKVTTWTWTLRGGRQLGTFSYTNAEAYLPVSQAPIRSVGECFLADFRPISESFSVAEASAYLRAVGCRPGRVLYRREKPDDRGYPPRGTVYFLGVHGGSVVVVQRGTAVDLIVQP